MVTNVFSEQQKRRGAPVDHHRRADQRPDLLLHVAAVRAAVVDQEMGETGASNEIRRASFLF